MDSFTSPHASVPSTASGAELLAQDADPAALSRGPRLHLPYLDGIRAIMALYVMHYHLLNVIGVHQIPFRLRPNELVMVFHQGALRGGGVHRVVGLLPDVAGFARWRRASRWPENFFFASRPPHFAAYYASLFGAESCFSLFQKHASSRAGTVFTFGAGGFICCYSIICRGITSTNSKAALWTWRPNGKSTFCFRCFFCRSGSVPVCPLFSLWRA